MTQFQLAAITTLAVLLGACGSGVPHTRVDHTGTTRRITKDDCQKIPGRIDNYYRNIRSGYKLRSYEYGRDDWETMIKEDLKLYKLLNCEK